MSWVYRSSVSGLDVVGVYVQVLVQHGDCIVLLAHGSAHLALQLVDHLFGNLAARSLGLFFEVLEGEVFDGATGLLEEAAAEGGTLFLDEIGQSLTRHR